MLDIARQMSITKLPNVAISLFHYHFGIQEAPNLQMGCVVKTENQISHRIGAML